MNLIFRAITILVVATVIDGTPLAVFAQSPQTLLRRINAEELLSRGVDKVETGNYQGAIEDFNLALKTNPQLIEAYCNRGIARAGLGDYKSAIADFSQALRLNPKYS